jgi:hypothetical protein
MNLLFEKNSFLSEEKKNHWNNLLSSIMSLPSYHRARYQALKLLLDFLPVEELIDIRPSLFKELILSIKDRDIAASVSSLFLNLCQSLQQKSDSSSSSSSTVVPFKELQLILCDALTSNDSTLRINLADYLLPDLLKLSKYFNPLELLVFLLGDYSSREDSSCQDGFLWAAVQFVLHTKLNGFYEKIETDSPLSAVRERMMECLKEAALSDDDMLRLTALTTLTVSQKTSANLVPSEIAVMKECFLFSLKSAESDNCSKIVRALRHYLIRAKYSSKEKKNEEKEEKDIYEETLDWLFAAFNHSFLPGVIPHDKEYSHLIVIETIFETSFENPTSKKSSAGNQGKAIEEPRVVKHLSKQFLSRLLRGLTSDFERSRKLVSQLLFQLPRPWAKQGISNREELLPLLDWGKSLAESAKLKESDAGAQFIVSLFKIFCWDLKWNVFEDRCSTLCSIPLVDLFSGIEDITGKEEEKERLISCLTFISYFANELEFSVTNLSRVFQRVKEQFIQKNGKQDKEEERERKEIDRESDYPLAHGIVVVLKLSLQYFMKNGISLFPKRIISRLTKQILSLGLTALNSAMEIVAENKRKLNSEENSSKGPINSSVAISMAATFVNTNSFSGNDEEETGIVPIGQGSGEDDDDDDQEGTGTGTGGMNAQRAIVAAWLLVKESTALLAALVEMIPVPSKEEEKQEKEKDEQANNDILNQSEVENIGEVLLDTLGRLKHMGAIAEAHVALQSVCTTIFKYGEKNQKLSNLPFHWLKGLLDRLYSQRQIFILRRSAGFAYSFLSILRSEPSNANPVLLFHAMESLMTVVKNGIYFEEEENNNSNDNDKDNDEKEEQEEEKEKREYWKLSVHALNVIRLILLDSSFGNDLDRFIGDMMVSIIRGFQSPIWSVRNSSMMCFSAIIQRIVSRKDKNHQNNSFQFNRPNPSQKISDHGNMNIEEFFQRYSSLFPFLLNYFQKNLIFHNNEITNDYLSMTTTDMMIGTTTTTSLSFQENQENSLFAILLFFSKFKLFVNNEAENKMRKENEKEKEKELPLVLFLPFFEKCLVADSSLQIRSIAAKAIVKIVPVSQFPVLLKYKLTELKAIIELSLFDNSDQTNGSVYRQRNQIHGRLLQILEFIQQFSNYSMIYFPFLYKQDSSSSSLKEQCDQEQSKVVSEIHRVFLVIFRELVARFFSVYYHPLHSLVLVQIFHQFQFLLELYSLETEKEEILAMKNEFLVRYLVSTNKFIASSKIFPSFPLNVQSFYEILLQESPLTFVPTESKEEMSFLSWIVSSNLIEKSSREVKLGILAGITSFVEKNKETAIQLDEFQYLSQQIMQRIVEEKDEVVLLSLIETFLR